MNRLRIATAVYAYQRFGTRAAFATFVAMKSINGGDGARRPCRLELPRIGPSLKTGSRGRDDVLAAVALVHDDHYAIAL